MTRDEINEHIARLVRERGADDWNAGYLSTLDAAIAMFRERLSKLDGPAEGCGRVWIRVRDYYGDGDLDSVLYQHKPAADDECGAAVTLALVVADIPLRQVPTVIGEALP